jgi:hypothetical protein
VSTGDPVLWDPPCAAIQCPLHPKEAPPRRRSSTRSAVASRETAVPIPRRSKLEVANDRNRKLLMNSAAKKRGP